MHKRYTFLNIVCILLLSTTLFLNACTPAGGELSVLGTTPKNGQSDVVTNSFIEIMFSAPMDKDSVQEHLEIQPAIIYQNPPTWVDNTTIRLVPVNLLYTEQVYRVTLRPGAKDLHGRVLSKDAFTWYFTTLGRPAVLSNSPTNGAQDISPNTPIRLAFNRPMNKDSVLSNSNVRALGLQPDWQENGRVLVLQPRTDGQSPRSQIELTINSDARDIMDNAMGIPYQLKFTLGSVPIHPIDTTIGNLTPAPTPTRNVLTGTQPSGGATVANVYNIGSATGGAGSNGSSPENIAFNPLTQRAYVVNRLSNNISVIDASTSSLIATIGVRDRPSGIAIDHDRNLIYIANFDSNTISVISGTTNSLILNFPLPYPYNYKPDKLALLNVITSTSSLSQTFLYVTHPQERMVSVINLSTNAVDQVLTLPNPARDLTVDERTERVYVATGESGVVVINARTNKFEDPPLPTRSRAEAVGIDPNLGRVYVTHSDGTLDIYGTIGGPIVRSNIFVGRNARDVVVDTDQHVVYVVGEEKQVVLIDGISGERRSSLALERGSAYAMALAPAINRLYLTHPSSNAVTDLDLTSGKASMIALRTTLEGMALDSHRNVLYVLDSENNQVYQIAEGNVSSPVPVPLSGTMALKQIVVDEENGRVYVAGGNQVYMLDGQRLLPLSLPLVLSDSVSSMILQGPYLYISLSSSNAIVLVDKLSNQPVTTWQVAEQPNALAVYTPTNRLYISHGTTGLVSVVDATNGNQLNNPASVGGDLRGLAIAPNGTVYVTSFYSNTVQVLGPDLQHRSPIPVGRGPSGIALLPRSDQLFVACTSFDQVSIINTQTNSTQPAAVLPANSQPSVVLPDPSGNRVYVINKSSSTISVVQPSGTRTGLAPTPTRNSTPGVTPTLR